MHKINILGFGISRINMEELKDEIGLYVASGKPHYVFASNIHTIMTSQKDVDYRKINNAADLSLADGKPIVWAARALENEKIQRICGRDLMTGLCQESVKKGYSHFFYGARKSVLERLTANLKSRHPGIKIAGYYSPPFRALTAEEDAQVIRMINDSGADLVWIGLGAPKQEKWIAGHLGKIKSPVMLAVGAAFDFHAGNVSQAPRWIQAVGLEWLFRFFREPHRLWQRYMVNNPRFVLLLICQLFKLRRFPPPETAACSRPGLSAE